VTGQDLLMDRRVADARYALMNMGLLLAEVGQLLHTLGHPPAEVRAIQAQAAALLDRLAAARAMHG
jgi:hypothetical protein